MLTDFVWRKLHLNYINSYEKIDHNDHLNALRMYLDSKGMRMPKPKWKYDAENKKTWHVLEGYMFRNIKKDVVIHRHEVNPHFVYNNLVGN